MNSTTNGKIRGRMASWGLLGVLTFVLIWNVLGERGDLDALSNVTDEVLGPEIPVHRTSSPLPMVLDSKSSDIPTPDMDAYVIVDRLSGQNVTWADARWERTDSQHPVPVVLKPDAANSLRLSLERTTDLRSGLATLEIDGSDKFEEDLWAGAIDPEENIIWVDAFAELDLQIDATQLLNVTWPIEPKVRILLRPEVPHDLPFRKPILRGVMLTDRLAPDSFRSWAKRRGLISRDFWQVRRMEIGEGASRNESLFVPLNCNVWILISGSKSWSPLVRTATLRRGETTQSVMRLSAPLKISGRVLNALGEPVPKTLTRCKVVTNVPDSEEGFPYTQDDANTFFGAVRRAGASSTIVTLSQSIETDEEGRFAATFPITDTVVCYCIREEGSAVKVVELGSRDAEPPFITLRLTAKPSHLRILDGSGNPLANTSIKFVDTEPRVRLQINYPPVNTDADGWLEKAHFLEPGVRYWIHPTGKRRLKQTFTYRPGATVVIPD